MQRTIPKFSRTVLLLTLAAGAVIGQNGASGVGRKFGARDPRTCSSRKQPAKGPLTAAQAREYFICDNEMMTPSGAVGDLLYLVSDVAIEVGKGRPFNAATDSYNSIDPSQMIYPIRGTYVGWQCGVAGSIGSPAGKNCSRNAGPTLGGSCYKDAFGDWHCNMCCYMGSSAKTGYPPPTGQ